MLGRLRESIGEPDCTEEARAARPTPLDEVRAGLDVFERTLLDVTPAVIRELEDSLARYYPAERFEAGPSLRWGTWIGGDCDGTLASPPRSRARRSIGTALPRSVGRCAMSPSSDASLGLR